MCIASQLRVLARPESPRGRLDVPHPVQPERPPVVPVDVVGHQVPALPGGDHADGLDGAVLLVGLASVVAEAHPHVVATGAGERHEDVGTHLRGRSHQGVGGEVDRADRCAEPRWHHLLQLGERAHRRLAGAGHGAGRREPQRDRRGRGLVVVQEQGRHPTAGTQPVATAHTGRGAHGVAEAAQPLHVPADRAVGDAQLLGEVDGGPGGAPLQQPEQSQHPRGGSLRVHPDTFSSITDRICP
jgi:hypothetical protein